MSEPATLVLSLISCVTLGWVLIGIWLEFKQLRSWKKLEVIFKEQDELNMAAEKRTKELVEEFINAAQRLRANWSDDYLRSCPCPGCAEELRRRNREVRS